LHPIAKIVIGAILIMGSAWVVCMYTLDEFWLIVKGIVPPLVFIVGLFIVWLECDELRIERELKQETARACTFTYYFH
jgi:hypothetical protein